MIDIFLLDTVRSANVERLATCKQTALSTRVFSWQIHSFNSINEKVQINYLGGDRLCKVTESYPQINCIAIPDWEKKSALHILLQAPFSKSSVLVTYSNTIFRNNLIKELLLNSADVIFGFDLRWKPRNRSCSIEDIDTEKLPLSAFDKTMQGSVVFTGLIYLKQPVVDYLSKLSGTDIGVNLMDLLYHLQSKGFSIEAQDVGGYWTEINSSDDVAHFIFGTKAETLARLETIVSHSHIGKQVSFTLKDWRASSSIIISSIKETFNGAPLIVRSSAKREDSWHSSNAGCFASYLNVDGQNENSIRASIEAVIDSYLDKQLDEDQILIQEFLQNVRCSGVVFTRGLETGSPYYRINFDDKTKSTEAVTTGLHGDLRTIIVNRHHVKDLEFVEPELVPVLRAVQELENLLCSEKLDIEFAIDLNGIVHVFQVRPITVDHSTYEVDDEAILRSLAENSRWFLSQQTPSPFVFGNRAIFGNMPDWNPAEIIGTRPKPLAFSLYRELITNEIWALQRAEFGYRDVRPCPLVIALSGQPYVDVRGSLNSFIPSALPADLAKNLARIYLQILMDNPHLHDKVEFDVAFTIWTPTFEQEAVKRLLPYGFNRADIELLGVALKALTCNALTPIGSNIEPIKLLTSRRAKLEATNMSAINKIFALLDDCRRYGTLAFCHAARASFVATSLLTSFVSAGIISAERRLEFLASIKTVARELEEDKTLALQGYLRRDELVERYGHLRPGTYELTAQAYWEDPQRYFAHGKSYGIGRQEVFSFTTEESDKVQQVLIEIGSALSPTNLADYLRQAIQARETVKFNFTRNLSRALDICIELASHLQLTRDQFSYIEYSDLEQLKLNIISPKVLKDRIEQKKKSYAITELIELPSLITQDRDFYCFERHTSQPNFVTTKRILSGVRILNHSESVGLAGQIVLIPQADPGFDWLFGYGIGGLITKFGGANSHMAIRAAEIGLPSAIGVGEKLYEQFAKMRNIDLDCANRVIREVQ